MFSKKELQIFLFSWIQTFKRSFLVFIKHFWWLVALEILFKTYLSPPPIIHLLNATLITCFSILSIRASIETKDLSYFLANLKKIVIFAIPFATLFITCSNTIILPALLPFLTLVTLFFLDDNANPISNAYKAIVAYAPPFFIIVLFYLISYFTMNLLLAINFILTCALAILYLKMKHEKIS